MSCECFAIAVLCTLCVWFALYLDDERRVDLSTQQYVDLEEVASLANVYDVVSVFALLLTLFSALECAPPALRARACA